MTDQIIQFLYVLLFSIIAIWVTVYINNRSHLKKTPWCELAQQTDLKYVNNYPAEKAYVMGQYCGHQLKLDAIHDPVTNAGLYTRITLSPSQDNVHPSLENELTIEQSANLLSSNFGYTLKGKVNAEANGQTIAYTQPGIENEIKYLQTVFGVLNEIAKNYPSLVALGGEFIPPLTSLIAGREIRSLRPLAIQLIRDIGAETTNKYGDKTSDLLCPHCLTRYASLQARISRINTPIIYYGCRACHQSREYLQVQVIAVLNDSMTQLQSKQNDILRVNWSKRRKLFDFDKIELVQTTNKDVELFAVQVGNDTDPFRQASYKKINCVVSSECMLSENTMRILQRMFGQVEKEKPHQGIAEGIEEKGLSNKPLAYELESSVVIEGSKPDE